MTEQRSQPEPLRVVAPAVTPVSFVTDVVHGQGVTLCRLQLFGPTGTFVMFLQPAEARAFAKQLGAAASQASSGLILPG